MRNLFAEDESAGIAPRQVQGAGLFVLAAQLFDGSPGGRQLFLSGSAFHGQKAAAHFYQRQAVLRQHRQGCHGTGRGQIKLLPPHLAGGFLSALLGKLHARETQLGAGILQKLHPLARGLHQGKLQLRLVDFCHNAGETGTGTHIHHLPCHFRLGGKEQAVKEMLILNALRVGDGSQVDFLVVVHQDPRKGVQLVQLGACQGDVPHGTFLFQSRFVDHNFILPSIPPKSARDVPQAETFQKYLSCTVSARTY